MKKRPLAEKDQLRGKQASLCLDQTFNPRTSDKDEPAPPTGDILHAQTHFTDEKTGSEN